MVISKEEFLDIMEKALQDKNLSHPCLMLICRNCPYNSEANIGWTGGCEFGRECDNQPSPRNYSDYRRKRIEELVRIRRNLEQW